ncbi:hypothetical protein CSKR_113350 [Clonorchis sinensis]|uniref:Uncharacterized protein n=1 Tax=Clonorchis sinensis TaxID=79923 RepID=A0A419Q9W1_CLOSI|nr:hypothetical protein CSKR_113350 [Clonorchis sinensis]
MCILFVKHPAESLVCDVSRQLNVLHLAASCFSFYDIQEVANLRQPGAALAVAWKHRKREIQVNCRWGSRKTKFGCSRVYFANRCIEDHEVSILEGEYHRQHPNVSRFLSNPSAWSTAGHPSASATMNWAQKTTLSSENDG